AERPERPPIYKPDRQRHCRDGRNKKGNFVQSEKAELILCNLYVSTDKDGKRDTCSNPDEEKKHDVNRELPPGPHFMLFVEKDHSRIGISAAYSHLVPAS